MIRPRILRKLDLATTPGDGGARHLSAGSGLVAAGDFLYVVADDELHLGCFRRWGDDAGCLVRIFPGALPREHAARKAAKPDLEALVQLPAFPGYDCGALLALPSGSTPQRRHGALLRLDAQGAISGTPAIVDFSSLYAALDAQLPALNIEGAVVHDDSLVLLHRGSRTHSLSALIDLSSSELYAGLAAPFAMATLRARCVRWLDLGAIQGVALSITDGASLGDGRMLVSAVAENSADSYADGPCLGAAIGVLDRKGRLRQLHHLQPVFKIEGLQAWSEDGVIRVWLVTDADDRSAPSCLLEVELSAADQTGAEADRL